MLKSDERSANFWTWYFQQKNCVIINLQNNILLHQIFQNKKSALETLLEIYLVGTRHRFGISSLYRLQQGRSNLWHGGDLNIWAFFWNETFSNNVEKPLLYVVTLGQSCSIISFALALVVKMASLPICFSHFFPFREFFYYNYYYDYHIKHCIICEFKNWRIFCGFWFSPNQRAHRLVHQRDQLQFWKRFWNWKYLMKCFWE